MIRYISVNKIYPHPDNHWPRHKENETLDQLYNVLEELGYQISDEERVLMTSEHELFEIEA